jgi:hypothetical protein
VPGPADRNDKLGALIRDLPLTEANPHIVDPSIHLDTELPVAGEPPAWDLRPGQLKGRR